MKRAGELFARGNKAPAVVDARKVIDELHRKIGQLQPVYRSISGHQGILQRLRIFGQRDKLKANRSKGA